MADWNNWAETVNYEHLEREYEPRSLNELMGAIDEARLKGWKVRAVGQGHAWSNLGVPRNKGAIIDMRKLNKLIKIDKPAKLVEVEGGMSVEALNDLLFQNGLALRNMGDANPQTIAGAFSTETHGSGVGPDLGSLSEFVEGIKIVRADGKLEDLAGDDLKAGRVSLGRLGAIYSVTLSVRDVFYLHHKQGLVKFIDEKPLLANLLQTKFLEYWYYPYTGMAERITREELPNQVVDNPLDIFEEWFIKVSSDVIEAMAIHHPERLPKFFRDHVKRGAPGFDDFERKGPSHKLLLGKSNVWRKVIKSYTMEYQFPLVHLWDAVQALDDSIALAERKGVYVAAPIQFRFTKKSERSFLTHLLHQPTVSFSVSFFRRQQGAHTWLPELERRFIALQGKPHWGKMYYTPQVIPPQFETIRQRLDPYGLFNFQQALYTPDAEAFQDP